MAAPKSILDSWSDLVDDRTGIVRQVYELFVDDDEPRFVHFLSTSCDTEAFGYLPNFGNNGGVGITAKTAVAKAVGEAVERYCSAMFRYDELTWSSYGRIGTASAPDPRSFALYSPSQYGVPGFPWAPFEADTELAWVPGISLVTRREVLVPAAFVYVPYHYQRDRGDTPIAQPISTGLACGESAEEATLSALCEVVERDAFTITWQAALSRPRIRLTGLPAEVADAVARFHGAGLEVHIVDLTSDAGCPTVLSVAEGFADSSPALAVAAAAHPVAAVAARKSLEELAHTRKYAAQVMDYLPPVPVDVAGSHPAVDGQRAHLRFYCPQDAKEAARFLWSSEAEVSLSDVGGPEAPLDLDALVTRIAATGEDVIVVDVTTPDVAEIGLHVVRVVVPGFHPLHMGHANRCLGGRRLARALRTAPGERLGPAGDNPNPHPFP